MFGGALLSNNFVRGNFMNQGIVTSVPENWRRRLWGKEGMGGGGEVFFNKGGPLNGRRGRNT